MKVQIKYHVDGIEKLKMIPCGDWCDLRAAEDVHLNAFEEKKISLGVSMKLPDGYEAILAPRSSTYDKWGIIQTNSIGVIDNSYSGDQDIWAMPVLAIHPTFIGKGDRICQFRIQRKMEPLEFEKVDFLEGPDRGGFGSTGTN